MTPRAVGWAVGGAFAGLVAGLLLAIPLADSVRDQPPFILAITLLGAPLGWVAGSASRRVWDVAGGVSGGGRASRRVWDGAGGVSRGGVEGTPPTADTTSAVKGGEASKPSEAPPATALHGLVLIPEGATLSGVLTCERLIVHGSFIGTIHVGASWDNETRSLRAAGERSSSPA